MRRVLAITLLLGFLLPGFALPLTGGADAVPVCCRAHGQHRCMSMVGDASARSETASFMHSRCPAFGAAAAWTALPSGLVERPHTQRLNLFVLPDPLQQADVLYRIAWSRSRQKRGPPAVIC